MPGIGGQSTLQTRQSACPQSKNRALANLCPLTARPTAPHPRRRCPYSYRPAKEHVAHNALAFAIRDGFPVSPGHTLIIPFREVPTWFDASHYEQLAILALVDVVKAQLDAGDPRPDGYNVGFNAGEAAGQTVMHLHVHVIPRYTGDMPDPRGGVLQQGWGTNARAFSAR